MRSTLLVAVLWAVPFLADRPAWAADKPADLLIGKWAGSLKLGDSETTLEFEFTKDGKAEMTVLGSAQSWKYWVLHNGNLLFLMEFPDRRGGWRTSTFELPCKVTKDRLEMDFRRHEAFRWPMEYKRVK
jgi:hypothetical protein